MAVHDGVFQGECLSTAAFCLVLHEALLDFLAQLPDAVAALVSIFAYIDDLVLAFPPQHFDTIWPHWCAALERTGLFVEPTI